MRLKLLMVWLGLCFLSPVVNGQVTGDYAIQAEISHATPYIGQTITYTARYYAYDIGRIPKVAPVIFPNFDDFWVGQVYEKDPEISTINHVQYYVREIEFEIVPLITGTVRIAPSQLILLKTDYAPLTSELSNEIILDVRPLPENPPDHFIDGVGQYRVNFQLDRSVVRVGERLKLTAEIISLSGGLDHLQTPKMILSDQWHVAQGNIYPTVVNEFNPAWRVRVFEWQLIPLESGLLIVDRLMFSYFDPVIGEYVTLEQSPLEVEVIGETIFNLQSIPRQQLALKVIGDRDRLVYPPIILWLVPAVLLIAIVSIPFYHSYQQEQQRIKHHRSALNQALNRIADLSQHPTQEINRRTRRIVQLYLRDKAIDTLSDDVMGEIQALFLTADSLAYNPNIQLQEQDKFITEFHNLLTQIDAEWGT